MTVEASDAYCWFDSNEQLRGGVARLAFARPPRPASQRGRRRSTRAWSSVLCADSPLAAAIGEHSRPGQRDAAALGTPRRAGALRPRSRPLRQAPASRRRRADAKPGPFNHAGMMFVASGKGLYSASAFRRPVRRRPAASRSCRSTTRTPRSTCAWPGGRASRRPFRQFLNCVWQVFPQARAAPAITTTASRRAS